MWIEDAYLGAEELWWGLVNILNIGSIFFINICCSLYAIFDREKLGFLHNFLFRKNSEQTKQKTASNNCLKSENTESDHNICSLDELHWAMAPCNQVQVNTKGPCPSMISNHCASTNRVSVLCPNTLSISKYNIPAGLYEFLFLATSRFCSLFKHCAQLGSKLPDGSSFCPLSSSGKEKGCFGWTWGCFVYVHILEEDVWWLSTEQWLGVVFWAK